MLTKLRNRRHDEEGFTLIELMVVVLIIAILIAIAIPTFLGAQNRARDRGAQSDLRNALTAAKTVATDHSGYFRESGGVQLTSGTLTLTEPSLAFDVIANASDSTIGLLVTDTGAVVGTRIILEKRSGSGTYFGISSDSDGRVSYCKGAQADCNTYTATKFIDKW